MAGGGNDRVNFAYLEDVGDMVAVALAEDGVWGGWKMVLLGLL